MRHAASAHPEETEDPAHQGLIAIGSGSRRFRSNREEEATTESAAKTRALGECVCPKVI